MKSYISCFTIVFVKSTFYYRVILAYVVYFSYVHVFLHYLIISFRPTSTFHLLEMFIYYFK